MWFILHSPLGGAFKSRFPERLSRQSSQATIDGESAGRGLFYPPPPPSPLSQRIIPDGAAAATGARRPHLSINCIM